VTDSQGKIGGPFASSFVRFFSEFESNYNFPNKVNFASVIPQKKTARYTVGSLIFF